MFRFRSHFITTFGWVIIKQLKHYTIFWSIHPDKIKTVLNNIERELKIIVENSLCYWYIQTDHY